MIRKFEPKHKAKGDSMAPRGRPKKKPAKKPMTEAKKDTMAEETEKKDEKTLTDEHMPDKASYRADEVAYFFDVTVQTIRNWVTHGRLEALSQPGYLRITKRSVLSLEKKMLKNNARRFI